MSVQQPDNQHPYKQFEGTRQWCVLEKALDDLSQERKIEEKTERRDIIGYLCNALSPPEPREERFRGMTEDEAQAYVDSVVERAHALIRQVEPTPSSMVEELIMERRREAVYE